MKLVAVFECDHQEPGWRLVHCFAVYLLNFSKSPNHRVMHDHQLLEFSEPAFCGAVHPLIIHHSVHYQLGYRGKKGYYWQYSHNTVIGPIKCDSNFYVLIL